MGPISIWHGKKLSSYKTNPPASQELALPDVGLDGELLLLLKVLRDLVAELPDVSRKPRLVLSQIVDLGLDVLADAGDQKLLDFAVHLGVGKLAIIKSQAQKYWEYFCTGSERRSVLDGVNLKGTKRHQDSNTGGLGGKQGCYLCAMLFHSPVPQ